jgi:hypothetical protein
LTPLRRSAGLLFCAALVVWAAAPAWGRDRKEDREAHALAQLRRDGEAAITGKDFAAAARAYHELYRRTLQPEGLYRLGILAHTQGRLLAAQDLLRRFLSDARFDPSASAAEAAEAQRILSLPRPPSGKVNVIGERGALVLVDGNLVGALPLSRPLLCEPGKRKFTIEDGPRRQEDEIDLSVGRFVQISYNRSSAALLSAELAAVLVREQYEGLPAAAVDKLAQAVEEGLQGERLSPFPLSVALERAGLPRTSSCVETDACQVKIARQNELDYTLNLQFTARTPGAPWELRLVLLDVEVGEEAARSQKECAACDPEKGVALLRSELLAVVATARSRPRGELSLTSVPAGAEVRLGGRVLGTTPLTRAAWAGPYEAEISLPGYQPQRLPFTVSAGEKTALAVTLLAEVAEPAPAPLALPPPVFRFERQPRPRWRLALGGVAVVGGAILAGFGISGLAVADSCLVPAQPPAERCQERFGTTPIGAGLLGSGAALLVTGSVLLAIPGPRRLVEVPAAVR